MRPSYCLCSSLGLLLLLATMSSADVTIVSFHPDDVFVDTTEDGVAQLDTNVGVVGCAFESFEDSSLMPGLTIAYEGREASSVVESEDLSSNFPDATWDGSTAFLPTVRDTGNELLPATFSFDPPVDTVGLGLGDIETDLELIVNGENFGLIRDLPGYASGAGDNAREIYVRADAGEGERISSVVLNPVNSGGGDGVFIDHLAFGTPERDGGLSHYWPLDSMIDDILGNAASAFVGTPNWVIGRYGYGGAFSGESCITTDWAPHVPVGGSFSFTVWIRHSLSPDANYYLLGLERSDHQEISLGLNGNTESMVVRFRDDDWISVDASIPWALTNDGDWHHVVGVLDGDAGTVTMYLDGVRAASGAGSLGDINLADAQTMAIGANNNSSGGLIGEFPGVLDDLRFFNSALSADEVRMLCPHRCRGDFNADGERNTLDLIDYLNSWSAGCP